MDRITEELDKLYNTDLLFGETLFKYHLHFSLACFNPVVNKKVSRNTRLRLDPCPISSGGRT